MTENTTAAPAPARQVLVPGRSSKSAASLLEEVAERQKIKDFFNPMQDAVGAGDVAALQAAVPGLTQKEAASLIAHSRRLRAARLAGDGRLIFAYARTTWGTVPPRAIVAGAMKVRVWGLLALCPGLSLQDARAIIAERVADELAELAEPCQPDVVEPIDFRFWRYPVDVPDYADARAADKMLRERQAAHLSALLSILEAPLREAYAAVLQSLEASGLSFELLAEWHNSGRAVASARAA
jgi:hypothetical protein